MTGRRPKLGRNRSSSNRFRPTLGDAADSVDRFDCVVIGSGPNGLVAAALLARAGWSVLVLERNPVAGGSIRSEELFDGYVHDTHSAFYGILHASPVFKELGLDRRVQWARHESPIAAAVAPDEAGVCRRSVEDTAYGLGVDGQAWRELYDWWLRVGKRLFQVMLAPIPSVRPAIRFVRAAGLGGALDVAKMQLEPLEAFTGRRFTVGATRALLASGVTHMDLGVDATGSVPGALILAMVGQELGMPVPVGGAGRLAEGLVAAAEEAGATVRTGAAVSRVVVERGRAVGVECADGSSVSVSRAVVADTAAGMLFRDLVGEEHLPGDFLDGLRAFRHGTGIFKVDMALSGAVPWKSEDLAGCGVVHLTGDLATMAESAFESRRGRLPVRPLLVVGQQTVADASRAPAGGHTLWIETHVPPVPAEHGTWDAARDLFLDRVLDRLEDHAPGLRELIVGLSVRTPPDLEAENPNLVGGDLGGGTMAIDQQLVFRPVPGWFRYATPVRGLYLCSAAAHPGGGVHGMGGRNCAHRVRADARIRRI